MSIQWYDRKGKPLTNPRHKSGSKAWLEGYKKVEKLLSDYSYKVVKVTPLWWGGRVSTVWLGLDQRMFDKGDPIIFETMVFPPHKIWGEDQQRYSTEEEAIKGHWQLYREWSNPITIVQHLYWGLSWELKMWKYRRSK